jgi:HTH-type transcriptional regulator/antitoxin HigA
MADSSGFRPDWVSAPGDTISDLLRNRNMTLSEFAVQMSQTLEDTKGLLQGRLTITLSIARRLQRVLGSSVEFWMSRDVQYREDVARLHKVDKEWLSSLPLGDMIRFGWLGSAPYPANEVAACLEFFDVPSVQAWKQKYAVISEMTIFRTSSSFDSRPGSVAAWLRQSEIQGNEIDCAPWSPIRFRELLSSIRPLTRQKSPEHFLPELQKICALAGVAVTIVRAPAGCRASGATRFLSSSKALLSLSFRYLSDDQFWFTVFHEAGHLLLHGQGGFFLEGVDSPATKEEGEANQFAQTILIPAQFQSELLKLPVNGRKVIRFAREIGISPGIVVGQLQHSKHLTQRQLNNLKRRFTWNAPND